MLFRASRLFLRALAAGTGLLSADAFAATSMSEGQRMVTLPLGKYRSWTASLEGNSQSHALILAPESDLATFNNAPRTQGWKWKYDTNFEFDPKRGVYVNRNARYDQNLKAWVRDVMVPSVTTCCVDADVQVRLTGRPARESGYWFPSDAIVPDDAPAAKEDYIYDFGKRKNPPKMGGYISCSQDPVCAARLASYEQERQKEEAHIRGKHLPFSEEQQEINDNDRKFHNMKVRLIDTYPRAGAADVRTKSPILSPLRAASPGSTLVASNTGNTSGASGCLIPPCGGKVSPPYSAPRTRESTITFRSGSTPTLDSGGSPQKLRGNVFRNYVVPASATVGYAPSSGPMVSKLGAETIYGQHISFTLPSMGFATTSSGSDVAGNGTSASRPFVGPRLAALLVPNRNPHVTTTQPSVSRLENDPRSNSPPRVPTPQISIIVPTVRTPTAPVPTVRAPTVPTVRAPAPVVRAPTITVRPPTPRVVAPVPRINIPSTITSDVRLKRDVIALGTTENGFTLYSFRYLDRDTTYVGVMAQEVMAIQPDAIHYRQDGLLAVDYAKLNLKFMTFDEWKAAGSQH